MVDIVRRHELALLDIHDPARAAGFEQQIGLPAEKRRDLENVHHFGRRLRLGRFMNVGQDGKAALPADPPESAALPSDPGPRYPCRLVRLALSKDALKT